MVIQTEPAETPLEKVLTEVRRTDKQGRNLVRALKKVQEGRIKSPAAKVGIMASILALPNQTHKQVLMGHWVDAIKGRLV